MIFNLCVCMHVLGHVRLFVTPLTVARQVTLSVRFSRQVPIYFSRGSSQLQDQD